MSVQIAILFARLAQELARDRLDSPLKLQNHFDLMGSPVACMLSAPRRDYRLKRGAAGKAAV